MLFLDNSNFLQIYDRWSLQPDKILKTGEAKITAADTLTEEVFVLGCSHGRLIVYNESYSRDVQSFEAHNDSVHNLVVNSDKVITLLPKSPIEISKNIQKNTFSRIKTIYKSKLKKKLTI